MNTLYESMTRFYLPHHGFNVRIWRHEPDLENVDNTDLLKLQEAFIETREAVTIADSILSMERVNAVEILDLSGQGVVAYKGWP